MFGNNNDFDFKFKDDLYLRYRISLATRNKLKVAELKESLISEIKKVNLILDKFKDSNKMFSHKEFQDELYNIYNDKEKALSIASSYIDLISPMTNFNGFSIRAIEYNQQFNKYRIINRSYNNFTRDFIYRSDLIRKLTTNNENISIYYPKTDKKDFDLFRVLYLMEIFDLCSYEIIGGESPEIFIRLNDPLKVRRLTSEGVAYKNEILQKVKKRHDNSTKILTKFFVDLKHDEERWDFIEDYFLGEDILNY